MSMELVIFNGASIAVTEKDNIRYVAMKPIVEAMGLNWNKQLELIKRDDVLISTMTVMGIVAEDGKTREMVCLPLDYLNGWLFKIPASRYSGNQKEIIVRYQKECYRVLFEYFHHGAAVNPAADAEQIAELKRKVAALEQSGGEYAYRCGIAEAELKHARNTIEKMAGFSSRAVSEFNRPSSRNGLPKDRIIAPFCRSDPRRHAPSMKTLQLLLPLFAELIENIEYRKIG